MGLKGRKLGHRSEIDILRVRQSGEEAESGRLREGRRPAGSRHSAQIHRGDRMSTQQTKVPDHAGSAESGMRTRHLGFCLSVAIVSIVGWQPLLKWLLLAMHDARYSYMAAVPIVSAVLVFWMKTSIFDRARSGIGIGGVLLLLSGGGYVAGRLYCSEGAAFAVTIACIATGWIACFAICYGTASLKAAAFAAGLLLFIIPLPASIMDQLVVLLQKGSATAAFGLFRLMGLPVLRNGFLFSLPGLEIEISEECSGIRSSVSLFLASMIAAKVCLRSPWKRLLLVAVSVPVVIAKNALRIVVITWLGLNVSRDFLFGELHRTSGIVFSPLAILVLGLVLWTLSRLERKSS